MGARVRQNLIKLIPEGDVGSSKLIVKQIPVGKMANFVYLVVEEESREAMVVDSGWETEPIEEAVRLTGAKVKFAVASHEHFDHVLTLRKLADNLGARVVAHESSPIDCDERVADGEELGLGDSKVQVLHTPGHTEDSICLYDGREVFTGDTLFVGTIGKFDRVRAEAIYRSLHEVILKLPGQTVMYPGHDYGSVTFRSLREEKEANPFLMTRDLRDFLAFFS
ncbi:MAG: hydroxyacylglutathione hydrolase family protein [Thaumarchaeota archaeon]|jgi:hydroxyacylglutathione hydrolase|nr:hydroxyacylglutathione hydrolase family protein [Nitrososphaerota archaeon]